MLVYHIFSFVSLKCDPFNDIWAFLLKYACVVSAGVKVRNLETQLDLADRKIRDYQKNQEKGNSVFLGDSSEFQKMINVRESATNASFMGVFSFTYLVLYLHELD